MGIFKPMPGSPDMPVGAVVTAKIRRLSTASYGSLLVGGSTEEYMVKYAERKYLTQWCWYYGNDDNQTFEVFGKVLAQGEITVLKVRPVCALE